MSHTPTVGHESMLCSHLAVDDGTCNTDHCESACWTSPQYATVVQQMPGFVLCIMSKGIRVDAGLVLSLMLIQRGQGQTTSTDVVHTLSVLTADSRVNWMHPVHGMCNAAVFDKGRSD